MRRPDTGAQNACGVPNQRGRGGRRGLAFLASFEIFFPLVLGLSTPPRFRYRVRWAAWLAKNQGPARLESNRVSLVVSSHSRAVVGMSSYGRTQKTNAMATVSSGEHFPCAYTLRHLLPSIVGQRTGKGSHSRELGAVEGRGSSRIVLDRSVIESRVPARANDVMV